MGASPTRCWAVCSTARPLRATLAAQGPGWQRRSPGSLNKKLRVLLPPPDFPYDKEPGEESGAARYWLISEPVILDASV